jgi:hypothetical protein
MLAFPTKEAKYPKSPLSLRIVPVFCQCRVRCGDNRVSGVGGK